ncbi:MAG: LamG domain-containing protein, partial [Crocinitomicaceae bacterium]|nr:LamG domain-containing protein [Crocinitomicaceae bacterium]
MNTIFHKLTLAKIHLITLLFLGFFASTNALAQCGFQATCPNTDYLNFGMGSNSDAASIEYDNFISSFHTTVVRTAQGSYKVWGESSANNGTTELLSPTLLNSANYPALTGTILKAHLGSNSVAGFGVGVQGIVLTTTGLFAWGSEAVVVHDNITSSTTFQKLTIGGNSQGLPSGVTPLDVKMLFVTEMTIALTTCSGNVYVLTQISANAGRGLTSNISAANATQWHLVTTSAAGNPILSNVVAVRGSKKTLIALTSAGELYTWGDETYLGNNSALTSRNRATLMTLPSANPIKMIGVTRDNGNSKSTYYVLNANGNLYALGGNNEKQIGDWSATERLSWVQPKYNSATGPVMSNIRWISPNEHDSNYANINVLTSDSTNYNWGDANGEMLGRGNTNGNNPGIPNGISASDKILAVETGGHTSMLIKKCQDYFGYVGHRIRGSMGDGTNNSTNESTYTFATAVVYICGATNVDVSISGTPVLSTTGDYCNGTTIDITATPSGGTYSLTGAATLNGNNLTFTGSGNNTVNLVYTYNVPGCPNSVSATLALSVGNCAIADAGPASASVCANSTYTTAGNSMNGTITWTTSGTGTFTNGSTNTATYTPSAADISAGTVTLTVTVVGTSTMSDNIVLNFTTPPSAGTLSGTQAICVGSTTTFASTVSGGAWTTSNVAIATVNSSGVVSGASAGTATITYTKTGTGGCANVTATRTVTVTAATSAGTLSGTQAICVGSTSTFASTVSGGAWTTSNASVATVNSSGVVSGAGAGTATITYTVTGTGGCADATATRTVTVTAAPSAGTLSGTQTACVGYTTTFTSTVSGGAWTTSNTSVATVNSSGVVSGAGSGTATITYTITGTGGCADATATRTVTINALPTAPTVNSPQLVCSGNTVADLQATIGNGETLQWFSASTGGSPLTSTTSLVEGTTYYAQATNSAGCVSTRTPLNIVFNNALDFDGVNDYVNVGDIIENLSDVTMEAWVYWEGSSLAHSEIFAKDGISSMAITSANKLHANFGDGSIWIAGLDSQNPIPLNKWTHVAVTRQGGTVKMFINGVQDGATTTNNATGQNSSPRIIGGKMVGASTANTLFNGRIDELRFWNIARTTPQISSNLTTQFQGNETNLLAYYNFNQGTQNGNNTSVTTLTNSVNSANNGTITNLTLNGTESNFVSGYFPEISGNSSVLAGSTIQLAHATSGGTWSSSNTSLATINSSGLVTGVAAGTVTMTYSNCGQSATYSITVISNASLTISSNISNFASCLGTPSTAQSFTVSGTSLTANVTVSAPTGYEVSLSSGSGYASSVIITASGTLNATTVYVRLANNASNGNVSGTLTISSTGATNQTVSLTGTVTTPPSAGTISGTTAICSNGSSTLSSTVTGGAWTSATPAVATINSSTGAVTGVAAGTSLMTYTITGTGGCADATATSTVTVTAAPSAGTLSGTTAICSNGSSTLSSTVTGGAWSSATPAVATINPSTGAVTGVTAGTSLMTYTITGTGGCTDATATSTVTVTAAPSAGTISGTTAICSNGSSTLSSTVTGGAWTSATPAVATINSSTGAVTGVAAGTSLMTYTITGTGGCADATATSTVTVTAAPSAGTISGTTAICSNGTSTLSSTVTGGAWTSATPAVATINSSTGAVTGVAAGTSLMTYTITGTGGCADATATSTVTVTAAPSAGTLSGTTAICSNGSSTLSSTVTGGAWTSATLAVATINSSTGAVTGVAAGTSLMTYTITGTGGCADATATSTVTVTAAPSAGTLSGTTAICSNGSSTLSSTVTGGTWSSATPAVATINSSTGAVTGVAAGTSLMTYTITG